MLLKRLIPTTLCELAIALEKKGIANRNLIFKEGIYQKINKERQLVQKENIIKSGKTHSIIQETFFWLDERFFESWGNFGFRIPC